MRQLLPDADGDEGQVIRRCRRRLARLRQRQPQKITDSHLFLASKVRAATFHNQTAVGGGRALSRQKVMALHGVEWQRLSAEARAVYEHRAGLRRADARGSAEAAIEEEHRRLQVAQGCRRGGGRRQYWNHARLSV